MKVSFFTDKEKLKKIMEVSGCTRSELARLLEVNYKAIYLGSSKDFNKAVKIRWNAEVKYEYPNCNSTCTAYLYLKERGLINE